MRTNQIKPKKNPIVALLGAPVVAIISVITFFTLSVLVLHLCGIYIDKRLASTIYGIIASGVSLTAIGLFFLIIISGFVLILARNVPKLPLLLKSRYLPLNHHDLEALNYTNYENIEGFISFLISQCSFEPNNIIKRLTGEERVYVERLRWDIARTIRNYLYMTQLQEDVFLQQLPDDFKLYIGNVLKYN